MESFEVRRNALFECLNNAEKSIEGTKLDQSHKRVREADIDDCDSLKERKISKFHGKESIFVKPELPITKCLKPRRQPDYQANPHKWKKYSLADADISDKTNIAAAFTFLKEIAEQKEANAESESLEDDDSDKIVFKKPLRSHKSQIVDTVSEVSDKPEMKGSKIVMPEYVVGQKPVKARKLRSKKTGDDIKNKNVKLDHLFDE